MPEVAPVTNARLPSSPIESSFVSVGSEWTGWSSISRSCLDCQVQSQYNVVMPASPPTAKGRATRERIVRAAAEMVAEQGVAAVTLDRVGARAPASRSQLYHYFADKDALVLAVVEETCNAEPSRRASAAAPLSARA